MAQGFYQMNYSNSLSLSPISKDNSLLENNKESNSIKDSALDYKSISYFTNRPQPDSYFSHQASRGIVNNMNEGKKGNVSNAEFSSGDSRRKGFQPKKLIRLKCFNCGQTEHLFKKCPLTIESKKKCFICNKEDHLQINCPLVKCRKCNLSGHKALNCTKKISKIARCFSCDEYGHNAKDCLINPRRNGFDKKGKAKCLFCNSNDHLICSFPSNGYLIDDYYSDDVVVSDSQSGEPIKALSRNAIETNVRFNDFYSIISFFNNEIEKDKRRNGHPPAQFINKKRKMSPHRIFTAISNEEIQSAVFCEKCGERHLSSNCNTITKFKLQHHKASENALYQQQVKNPLKFQPMMNPRTEFNINHHLPFKNYYEDDNSSGDSFREIVKDHLSKYNNAKK